MTLELIKHEDEYLVNSEGKPLKSPDMASAAPGIYILEEDGQPLVDDNEDVYLLVKE